MSSPHFATCNLCEAICGIVVETDGERVASIRGDAEDPFSRGHICPKAAALKDLHEDPDRLRRPARALGPRSSRSLSGSGFFTASIASAVNPSSSDLRD